MERVDHPTVKCNMLTETVVTTNAELANAGKDVDRDPSEKQKEAGVYKKGHVIINGLKITIENPKGSIRSGVDGKGKKWSQKMNADYGYFLDTEAIDGDHIDTFISDDPNSEKVFVIDQFVDGKFDEYKCVLWATDEKHARETYLSCYEKGWKGLKNITEIDLESFKKWLYNGTKRIKPFSEYVEFKKS